MMYTIRKLAPTDVELAKQLFVFFQEDDGETPVLPSDAYLQKLLGRDDFHVLVAMHDVLVVGGLTAYELDMYKEPVREIFLYEIGVEAAYRKQGIARALIERLKAICVEKNIGEMYVGAMAENLPAIKLYAATGGKHEPVAWFTYKMGIETKSC